MFWLSSRRSHVAPPSAERKSAELVDSMNEYTTRGSDGATVTSTRPQGPDGRPLFDAAVSGVHVAPPSAERYSPLALGALGPSPPERKVQPFLRKSHIPAKSTPEFFGSIVRPEQPVERLLPLSTSDQVL